MPKCLEPHLTIPMILGSWRAFILHTWKFLSQVRHRGCILASSTKYYDMQVMQWKPIRGWTLLSHAQHMRSLKSTLIMYVYFSPSMSTCVHYLLVIVIIIYYRVPSPILRKESHTTWQCLSIPIRKNYLLMDK